MKSKSLKKLLITFSLLLTVSASVIYACADGDWGWFGYSNFTPETFVDKSYKPLFYSANEMFYNIGYISDYTSSFNDDICSDWRSYLANKLDSTQLIYFLLNDSSYEASDSIAQYIKFKKNNETSTLWSTKIDLQDQKVQDFFEFLSFAKQIETSSVSTYSSWDYDANNSITKVDSVLISEVQNKYEKTKNPFLKNRYWFQTVKGYFYSNSEENVISFMDKTEKDVPKNTLYYRALAYKAGVNKHNQEYALANYQYSVVFDKCPQMRPVTAYNFHPQSDEDWNASLNLAKTADEKAALWALLGYYADPQRAIDEIFKLNPKSPHIDYLLTRIINQEEEKLEVDFTGSVTQNKSQKKDSLNKTTLNLITTIALTEKTAQPYLWYMAAGYLQTINQDFNQAKISFAKAERIMPSTKIAYDQLRLLRFINTLSEITEMNPTNEKIILTDLQWLYNPSWNEAKEPTIRTEAATTWSKNYISALYANQKNAIFAELFNRNSEFYKNELQLEAMKTYLAKAEKTPFEELAQSIYTVTLDDINEYQAIMATYQNKLDLANKYMIDAKELNSEELYGNPFNGKIKDCHDCDHEATQKMKYSKLKLIETMKLMQENSAKGEDLYNNYLLLGNAFYNITYFGNARHFYETKLIEQADPFFKNQIYGTELPKLYYQKALDAATSEEQKAKCTYLLAKCERNDYYNTTYSGCSYWGEESTQPDFLAWSGFVSLKERYANTKYYQDVINECGYFKTYIGSKQQIKRAI